MVDSTSSKASNDNNDGDNHTDNLNTAQDEWSHPNNVRTLSSATSIFESGATQPCGEEDTWSRQVETDELARMPSSVLGDEDPPSPPRREEPTLKEKLVERERQRRVETERARLKRQFVLRESVAEAEAEEDEEDGNEGGSGSVAGTVGDGSSVAPVDVLEDDAQRMNYPMERFLQEQGTILEEETPRESNRDAQNQGVLMERFLQEPVVVEPTVDTTGNALSRAGDPDISFDREIAGLPAMENPELEENTGPSSVNSIPGDIAAEAPRSISSTLADNADPIFDSTASMDSVPMTATTNALVDNANTVSLHENDMSAMEGDNPDVIDQPRVLGLTQAEIEELAAIDEVSQQNAPPSERDDLSASSFVAELNTEFGTAMDHHGVATLSQGTPTTAMESASNQSVRASEPESQHSADGAENLSVVSTSVHGSTAGGSASVVANPPSESGDILLSPLPDISNSSVELTDNPVVDGGTNLPPRTTLLSTHDDAPTDLSDLATLNAGVVNRQIRPGMVPSSHLERIKNRSTNESSGALRRIRSEPDTLNINVDGFDFDKDAPATPTRGALVSGHGLNESDLWSPGSRLSIEQQSPYRLVARRTEGLTDTTQHVSTNQATTQDASSNLMDTLDKGPTIPNIPTEIVTKGAVDAAAAASVVVIDKKSKAEILEVTLKEMNENTHHFSFPERAVTLGIIFLAELPILLALTGSGDKLYSSLGRSNYHLLMGLLPICNAVSGNASMQISTTATQAFSSGRLNKKTILSWLVNETKSTSLLGGCIALLLGMVTLFMSNFNVPFSLAISISLFGNVACAGITGTAIAFCYNTIQQENTAKWHGTLETTIHDIVSCATMVTIMTKTMDYFGPYDVCALDACSAGMNQST